MSVVFHGTRKDQAQTISVAYTQGVHQFHACVMRFGRTDIAGTARPLDAPWSDGRHVDKREFDAHFLETLTKR